MMLEQGIHADVPMEQYVGDCAPAPSLNAGLAQTILARSLMHAWHAHPRLNPNWKADEDGSFDLGSAAHAILLEQDYAKLAVYDAGHDWRKKEAQEFRAAARAERRIPVLTHQAHAIEAMVDTAMNAVERCAEVRGCFEGSLIENTIVWRTPAGTWCRCRPDLITGDRKLILSYKTTGNAEPDAFIRGPLVSMGYDIQAAHEIAGNAATGGSKAPYYVWLVQEIEAPYACSLIGYGPQMSEYADRKRSFALSLWQGALESGNWTGYRNEIHWASLPDWHVSRLEDVMEFANA